MYLKNKEIVSESEKNKIREELESEYGQGAGFHYDCLTCSHAMSTNENQLICVEDETHERVNEHHLCRKWN